MGRTCEDVTERRVEEILAAAAAGQPGHKLTFSIIVVDNLIERGGGDNSINGTPASDYILGNAGEDTINGRAGDDVLDGGADADSILGEAGNDSLFGAMVARVLKCILLLA